MPNAHVQLFLSSFLTVTLHQWVILESIREQNKLCVFVMVEGGVQGTKSLCTFDYEYCVLLFCVLKSTYVRSKQIDTKKLQLLLQLACRSASVETLERMLKYNRAVEANSYESRFSMHITNGDLSVIVLFTSQTLDLIFFNVVIKSANSCFLSSLTFKFQYLMQGFGSSAKHIWFVLNVLDRSEFTCEDYFLPQELHEGCQALNCTFITPTDPHPRSYAPNSRHECLNFLCLLQFSM